MANCLAKCTVTPACNNIVVHRFVSLYVAAQRMKGTARQGNCRPIIVHTSSFGVAKMGVRDSRGDDQRFVHCYAEGKANAWEAFCIDLDLAVQGGSFSDVYQKLNDQIELYSETVAALPEPDQRRLLSRHAPLGTLLALVFRIVCSTLGRRGRRSRHDYTHPMGPYAAA